MSTVPGCPNCSTVIDAGTVVEEEAAPAAAPPAPTPDAAADAPAAPAA